MPKWFEGEIIRIEEAGDQTKRFWLAPDEGDELNFSPGQFITMDLPIGEKRLDRWRSYSIANAPGEGSYELCIVHMPGGRATGYFFDEVNVGTTIRYKAPEGQFLLPEEQLEKTVVLICTGTGIAPFRSMLRDIDRRDLDFHRIHLIFGARFASAMLYHDEWLDFARRHSNFTYSIALSREEGALPDHAVKGYVHQIYQKLYAAGDPDIRFYLCGWSGMIDEAMVHLVEEMGFDRRQVIFELYG
jgi:CDP-4-dehydro-6-deoxyglucose reductase